MTEYSSAAPERHLSDYPISLQSAARALWGDDNFWGRDQLRPPAKAEVRRNRLSR
jgi:hypothetical protein